MRIQPSYAGSTALKYSQTDIKGHFVERDGEEFYVIEGIQNMDPFFMSIVSNSDHWMFISSNGALTAGRKKPGIALFPYYTVDKIHDSADITGAKTIIHAGSEARSCLWEPFSDRLEGVYDITRNLYKNIAGNKIVFEEINRDLRLAFAYQWSNSEKFGFVRKSGLTNLSEYPIQAELLDGIQNILPHGVDRMMQADKSCLLDAYKKCELVDETGLGIYMLSSIPVDRAEPSESLKANTVWSIGNCIRMRLLSSVQLARFRRGRPISEEKDVKGKRGAYFVNFETILAPGQGQIWYIIAEVNQTAAKVADLNALISSKSAVAHEIEADVQAGTVSLAKIVASADGLQVTNDKLSAARHFANTLFNVMRGGIFDNGTTVSKRDLTEFAMKANTAVHERNEAWFHALPDSIHYSELLRRARASENPGLIRMCLEYMPLTFGRRHGDPSRPWNLFAIETRNEDGSKILNYQGNWRDIFQNWEALALSFPSYIESMISKFVNASTADGYNPYRVTREGFEWEIQDPHDPWSFIGYWGDHQTIYLLKLLEISERYHPGRLQELLARDLFSYANVPYRIKSYQSILYDPYHSIDYDEEVEKLISLRVGERGADGKVIWSKTGDVYLVSLSEKLLVSILSKLSNFVPEGGIWMNTQRPEWNDANNALAGYGISMVTLYYLRRYIEFCRQLFGLSSFADVAVSQEVAEFLRSVHSIFSRHKSALAYGFDNRSRRALLDALGEAGSIYRASVYAQGFSEKRSGVEVRELLNFFSTALEYIDQSIRVNRRPDHLYHAYNLLSVKGDAELEVSHLYEMLEGQVAILSSGYLSAAESVTVLEALRTSAMFRADQYSYTLYPDRTLPRFVEKNNLPAEFVEKSELIRRLAAAGNRQLVEKDINGIFHFNGAFTNKDALSRTLETLADQGYGEFAAGERQSILDVYEAMFNHKAFTGRSGTFYSYEGLGSIYWHMVSKLLLAVEEAFSRAVEKGERPEVINRLRGIYLDVRKGLGTDKTPAEYGAFPTDPYSHTPAHSGAQQPGMTGQVKEDFIARFRELALMVSEGRIRFEASLLNPDEFLRDHATFRYFDVTGAERRLLLEPGTLAYTFCQVPVILKKSGTNAISLSFADQRQRVEGLQIDQRDSQSIFERMAEIQLIEVDLDLN
jgi:hypothetical protein